MKIISIISNGTGHTVQYSENGKGKAKTFPLGTSKKDIIKSLETGKPVKANAGKGKELDPEIKALQEKAKKLGVKGFAIMKKKETLLAKIAEAEAAEKNK